MLTKPDYALCGVTTTQHIKNYARPRSKGCTLCFKDHRNLNIYAGQIHGVCDHDLLILLNHYNGKKTDLEVQGGGRSFMNKLCIVDSK